MLQLPECQSGIAESTPISENNPLLSDDLFHSNRELY